MTDKKDGPGQKDGPAKTGDRTAPETSGAKRPFATIDLKAVEVPPGAPDAGPVAPKAAEPPKPKAPPAAMPKERADAAGKAAGSGPAQSAPSAASAGKSGAVRPDARPAAPRTETAAASAPRATTGKGDDAGAGSNKTSAEPPLAAARARGTGSFASHALAGLVGAAVALAVVHLPGVAPFLEEMGLAPPAVAPEVAQRLVALERKAAAPAPAVDPARDPARAIAAAEANGKRIEALQQELAALGETHARTAHLAAELEARSAKAPPIADVGERLVALEKQLTELGKAAQEEPDRAGRIPQLVQLMGRISDLETALGTRIAEARKDTQREIETRLAPVAEAGEAARTTAQRVDREVGALKGEINRISTGLDQVKTSADRLQLALKAAQDETAGLATSLDGLRRDMEGRLKAAAKPADVSAAVAPLAGQLAALERNVAGVVKSEGERNATAERIVLSLELGNLKRAMERGAPYARELAEVAKLSGSKIDLAPLQRYRDEGVPTLGELTRAFRPVANAILDAEAEKADGSVVDRLLSGAKSFVRVRKMTAARDDRSPEAVVARIEDALRGGRLGDVLAEAKGLEQKPAVAKDWIAKVEARQTVDAALSAIDEQLKASLGGASAAAPSPADRAKGQP